MERLVCLLPENDVRRIAEETGLVKRVRKIDPVAILWVLVLSFGVKLQRTLESIRRGYETFTGETICYSAWYERFGPELPKFLKECIRLAIQQTGTEVFQKLGKSLQKFKDLLIEDNTIVRLNKALAEKFPATRTRKVAAGVKVSLIISAIANGPSHVAIHDERTHDIKTLRIGRWIRNRILLLDLGFQKFQMFARIEENGGYFVTRLKKSANPLILASHRVHRGRAIDLAGKRWQEVESLIKRQILDVEVELSFRRRRYAGKQSSDTMKARLVAVYDDESGDYHVYLTNIPPDVMDAKDVADLYSVRWDVELVFKELKSRYALDVVTSKNENVVKTLIWTAILTLLVSRRLYNLLRSLTPEDKRVRFTQLRWANFFVENADTILGAILQYLDLARTAMDKLDLIMALYSNQVIDPHVNRKRLKDGWIA